MSGPYRIPHIHIDVSLLVTNKTPSGTYRGPGRFEADFFRERLLDMAAADLGIDRVEFRRRNLIAGSGRCRIRSPRCWCSTSRPNATAAIISMTLDRCLEEFDWPEKAKLQGRLIDGRYHGVGIGCYIEGGALRAAARTRGSRSRPTASVSVFVGSSSVGQGVETVFAQIAADALEMPMDAHQGRVPRLDRLCRRRLRLLQLALGGHGRLGDRGRGRPSLREAIRAAAAQRLDCARRTIAIDQGMVVGPDRAVARARANSPASAADGTYASNKRTYSYGAHAAHVAVDPKTGHVEVIDYVAVEDVGRIINPLTLHGQMRRRGRAGPRRRVARTFRLRRGRPVADRLVRRLSDADRERFPQHHGRSRWRRSRRRTIRSAPRARARAASFRSAA